MVQTPRERKTLCSSLPSPLLSSSSLFVSRSVSFPPSLPFCFCPFLPSLLFVPLFFFLCLSIPPSLLFCIFLSLPRYPPPSLLPLSGFQCLLEQKGMTQWVSWPNSLPFLWSPRRHEDTQMCPTQDQAPGPWASLGTLPSLEDLVSFLHSQCSGLSAVFDYHGHY